jgi:putative DNA methylase
MLEYILFQPLSVSRFLGPLYYKERKANYSQTLTGLGKWWGRKPLILVRAILLGLLLPSSDDPKKDREIFLKILTMDDEGLWQRKTKLIPLEGIYSHLTPKEREKWFSSDSSKKRLKNHESIKKIEREELQHIIFSRLSYDEKLEYCGRPENIDGPSKRAWVEINEHLGTNAFNLTELVQQLGTKIFGGIPVVGDSFCGGGSIPFEAARIGCNTYGSDLNPVASLLTWASLNIVGNRPEVANEIRQAQQEVYGAVDKLICSWGIEHNEKGWRADAYLYCNETRCPECGWIVPLAPSWIIGEKTRTIAKLKPDIVGQRFEILIETGVSNLEMETAKLSGTAKEAALVCPNPNCRQSTPMTMIRGDRRFTDKTQYGLRIWENNDIVSRPEDVFHERLYCIRWVETYLDKNGKEHTFRHYCAPNEQDFKREEKVLYLLRERFQSWQEKGYIPNHRIMPGDKTEELLRTKGWTHWHHLFTPRQLLMHGQLLHQSFTMNYSSTIAIAILLGIGRCADWNSKLCRWDSSAANEKVAQTFSNQALNPLFTFASKGFVPLANSWFLNFPSINICTSNSVQVKDARQVECDCNIWLTDPPYANAINYHELSEFFLAWYDKTLQKLLPNGYTDSKRALAITGSAETFRKSMVDCYRNLTKHMKNDGLQVVMFTHQDASVWADLALILWASGLCVTAAWCIATETDSALKEGNYVQGTVILILRKQNSDETAFLDEIYPQVENEVKSQLASMLSLEDQEEPNFSDTDYQLASYAAALRVLTQYKNIEDIDVAYELSKQGKRGEESPLEKIIADAVKVACDYLVPKGIDSFIWKTLTPDERFYLKGIEIGSHREYRTGAYQELARGFGLKEYKQFLSSGKANQARLKTATEFATKSLNDKGFGSSLVRNALFAIREVVRSGEVQVGKNWLRTEVKDYWSQRKSLIEILRYLSTMGYTMYYWKDDANAARLLTGALENDHT